MRTRPGPVLICIGALLWCGASVAQPAPTPNAFQLYAAGSLKAPFGALLAESGAASGSTMRPVYGPSGLLRQKLEHGAAADLFASSDLTGPEQLAQGGRSKAILLFARNQICAIGRRTFGLTTANVVSRMLDPATRLATSTPGSDPSGDYSQDLFRRVDRIQPGAGATLRAKAMPLLGRTAEAPDGTGHDPVERIFAANKADVLLSYCSRTSSTARGALDLVSVPMPPALEVMSNFGMVLLTDNPAAARFALYVMSLPGQQTLAKFGFVPIAVP